MAFANAIHQRLKLAQIAMTVFPRDEIRERRQTFNHRRREPGPIATVADYSESRRLADRAVVFKESCVVRLRIVRWKHEQAVSAGLLRGLGHLDAEPLPKTNTRDH